MKLKGKVENCSNINKPTDLKLAITPEHSAEEETSDSGNIIDNDFIDLINIVVIFSLKPVCQIHIHLTFLCV